MEATQPSMQIDWMLAIISSLNHSCFKPVHEITLVVYGCFSYLGPAFFGPCSAITTICMAVVPCWSDIDMPDTVTLCRSIRPILSA
jgi:hypothetical protein